VRILLFYISIIVSSVSHGQQIFEPDPSKAEFITSDIRNFWVAFDQIGVKKNPFINYIEKGSVGLMDFIPYRIESPKNLLKTVIKRKTDYQAIREGSYKVELQVSRIGDFYAVFKELYSSAVFPPTYFVIGAFNSGGTSSGNGLIIGVEVQNDVENIPYIVAHELIHFNQNYQGNKTTLLEQSIIEGSADFIGELISGKHINLSAYNYGNENEEQLCSEFVKIMGDAIYHGWLYGSKGKIKGRPNDLGYWIGYKICESFFCKSQNRQEAIRDILNIQDFNAFLTTSGYLTEYIAE
jgi:hypothetical protein